jgi:hypothetical protein
LNAKALEAAVMMRAGNEHTSDLGLSHAPGPTWPCFSLLGAAGAATSNLALGTSGADAIRAYVADDGVASLGHRRWILDPATTTFGSGSTGVTNALAVIGGAREPVAAGTQVPWPPAGAIAAAWVPLTWSVSVGGTGEPTTFDDPRVSMTVDGAAVAVSTVTDLGTSYGTGRTLAWTPAIDRSTLRFGYHRITVSISGARAAGLPVLIDYATTIGTPPAAPAATPTPTPGPTARPTPTPTPALAGLRPRIAKPRGATTVGTRLSASFTHGTGRIVTKVQWLRSGAPIRGATSVRYRVTRTDRGRTLRVQITSQSKDGSAVLTEQSVGVRIPR